MSDSNMTRVQYIAEMTAQGLVVSYPAENELQIDIDSVGDYERFIAAFEILDREVRALGFPALEVNESPSRSGYPKRHIRIELPWVLTPWERIAWQASLGSDNLRELLSGLRLRSGDEFPTILIEPPTEAIGAIA